MLNQKLGFLYSIPDQKNMALLFLYSVKRDAVNGQVTSYKIPEQNGHV